MDAHCPSHSRGHYFSLDPRVQISSLLGGGSAQALESEHPCGESSRWSPPLARVTLSGPGSAVTGTEFPAQCLRPRGKLWSLVEGKVPSSLSPDKRWVVTGSKSGSVLIRRDPSNPQSH